MSYPCICQLHGTTILSHFSMDVSNGCAFSGELPPVAYGLQSAEDKLLPVADRLSPAADKWTLAVCRLPLSVGKSQPVVNKLPPSADKLQLSAHLPFPFSKPSGTRDGFLKNLKSHKPFRSRNESERRLSPKRACFSFANEIYLVAGSRALSGIIRVYSSFILCILSILRISPLGAFFISFINTLYYIMELKK